MKARYRDAGLNELYGSRGLASTEDLRRQWFSTGRFLRSSLASLSWPVRKLRT